MWSYRLEAPRCLAFHDIPGPDEARIRNGQVILRFLAGGVCGSDLPHYLAGGAPNGAEPFGRSLHEIVGEVVASRCDLRVGERVVGWVDGNRGLCEYVVTAGDHLIPVERGFGNSHSVPIQPLAGVLYGISRLRRVSGASVAVLGLGSIGVLFTHVLKSSGAAKVVGIDVIDRSSVGLAFGADQVEHVSSTVWSEEVAEENAPDIIVEAVGHNADTLNDAIRAVSDCGEILYFGLPGEEQYAVNLQQFKDKHLSLHAGNTPGRERRTFLHAAQRYLVEHRSMLDAYVTHVLPVAEAQSAFELACNPSTERVKVVLEATR